MEKRKLNFLVYGQGTCLNKGCEAIINTTAKKIKKSCDRDIILATYDLNDEKLYGEYFSKVVNARNKGNLLTEEDQKLLEYYDLFPYRYEDYEKIFRRYCLKEIPNVDICLSVGGDNYSYDPPYWLYTINKEIIKNGKKNVFWCCSLFEKIDSAEMIRDLRTYDLIMARESLTYNALLEVVDKERVVLVPDTAFSLGTKEVELPEYFKKGKKVVGINVSPLVVKDNEEGRRLLESVKELVRHILDSSDYEVCLLPHVYVDNNNDLDTLGKIKELFKEEERVNILDEKIYNCEEIKYIISKLHILVAARTHASVAGYSTLVPTLVIGYSVKSKGIAKDLFGEYENYVLPYEKITPQNLIGQYEFIENNHSKIKDTLAKVIPDFKERAENLIEIMLEKLDELDKKYIANMSLCTGCMACKNICPVDAVEEYEHDGFKYTKINEEKCINCGLCRKVCPINKTYINKEDSFKAYGAKAVDENLREQSSSGGISSLIAETILANDGVVYGAELSNLKNKHVRIEKKEELKRIRGSKYIPSDVGNIYKKVKEDLENKKEVLFTGVPCQVEGLKAFLDKEYDNLYCAAVICHGVPSTKIFEKHIKEKEEKANKKIVNVNFRSKVTGWSKFSIEYEYEDGSTESYIAREDSFMKGFLKDIYLRESCYNCVNKMDCKNSADIILGDFWGIKHVNKDADDDKGISVVITCTDKGNKLLERVEKDKIDVFETKYEEIERLNSASKFAVRYRYSRKNIFEKVDDNTIEELVDKCVEFENGIKPEKEIRR